MGTVLKLERLCLQISIHAVVVQVQLFRFYEKGELYSVAGLGDDGCAQESIVWDCPYTRELTDCKTFRHGRKQFKDSDPDAFYM